MAADQSIPFPADIDRDAFGHWLSGLTDGEGCFYLGLHKHKAGYTNVNVLFQISLRADDIDTLHLIQSYWQCGRIYRTAAAKRPIDERIDEKDACRFRAERLEDMLGIVIPHFQRFPLRSKKKADFPIWCRGVELKARVSKSTQHYGGTSRVRKWTAPEYAEFAALVEALKHQRKYAAPKVKAPSPVRQPPTLFDGLPE